MAYNHLLNHARLGKSRILFSHYSREKPSQLARLECSQGVSQEHYTRKRGYPFFVPHFPATMLSAMGSHINISLTRNTSSAKLGDTDTWEAEAK